MQHADIVTLNAVNVLVMLAGTETRTTSARFEVARSAEDCFSRVTSTRVVYVFRRHHTVYTIGQTDILLMFRAVT